jgi:OOP family OmpA-OmpF porin
MSAAANHPKSPSAPTHDADPTSEWNRLRSLLFGAEQASLKSLASKIGDRDRLIRSLADALPDAAALRSREDASLTEAFAPIVNEGLEQSVRRNPRLVVDALYPIIGPAIRRSISEALAEMMQSFNRALEQSLSLRALKWRFDAWRTGQPYAKVVLLDTLVYRIEQVFLIHRHTGILLAHVRAAEVAAQDPSLVSGMLTAIRDFIGDSFNLEQTREGVESIRLGDLTVQVQVGPQAVLAAVVRGNAPDTVRLALSETLERIHSSHAIALVRFKGEMEPFASLTGDLAGCLSAQRRSTDRSTWQGYFALTVVGGLLVWGAAAHFQAVSRWNQLTDALRHEPGFVIIDADRNSRRIRALRDPLAREPSDVVGNRGANISWELSPYLSTDGSLVIARARRLLNAPSTITLHLDAGTLRASGETSDDWLANARARALFVPGVTAFDYRELKITDRDTLARARRTLLAAALYFEPQSQTLAAPQTAELDALLPSFRVLDAAGAQGDDIVVNIIGRADAPGTTEYNLRLSDGRADAVRRYLVMKGVSDHLLRARGLGATETSDHGAEADNTERRVNFAVAGAGIDKAVGVP